MIGPSDTTTEKPLGIAGRLTQAFIKSALTPLFILAALAAGMLAVASLPREEEPQISVPLVDIHVQADPALSLHDAHILSGMVKTAIRQRVPAAMGVLIHMEPFEPTEDA